MATDQNSPTVFYTFAWEQLALLLTCQKHPPMDEVVSAYERSAALFWEAGDLDKAMSIRRLLKKNLALAIGKP